MQRSRPSIAENSNICFNQAESWCCPSQGHKEVSTGELNLLHPLHYILQLRCPPDYHLLILSTEIQSTTKKNIFLKGDWRLLHLLAHNMNPIVFAEFVIELDNQVNLSIRWTLRRLSYHDKSKRQQYTSSSGPSTHERFCWKQWGQPTKATFSITLVICLPRIFNHAHNYIIGYLERKKTFLQVTDKYKKNLIIGRKKRYLHIYFVQFEYFGPTLTTSHIAEVW